MKNEQVGSVVEKGRLDKWSIERQELLSMKPRDMKSKN